MLTLPRSISNCVSILFLSFLSGSCGTNPGNGGDARTPGTNDGTAGNGVTILKFVMPDRASLAGEVKDISQKMTGYHLKVESVGDKCTTSFSYEEVDTIKDNGTVYVPVRSACDYVATVGFGPMATSTPPTTLLGTTINTLSTHYYLTSAPVAFAADKLKGKQEWKVPYWAVLQPDGQTLGLKTAGLGDKAAGTTPIPPAASITWTTDIKPIMDSSCVSCHGVNSANGDLSTYGKAQAHLADIVSEVVGGEMPPSAPLADDKKQLFQKWKDANFPEK